MILIPMSFISRATGSAAIWAAVLGVQWGAHCQELFSPQGGEFGVAGALRGDQTKARVSVKKDGSYLVWQDNATDGDGLGVSARRLDANFNPTFSPFRVNEMGAGDQELPQVTQLKEGGAAFVWQSAPFGVKRIVARFLDAQGKFLTGDVPVSPDNGQSAAVASTEDGGVVVSWSNLGSDGSLFGVYAQKLSGAGQKLGDPILVNQTTKSSQKSSTVIALPDGRILVAWVSEQQRSEGSSDIFMRLLNADLSPVTGELRVNRSTDICSNPTLLVSSTGGVVVAWSQRDTEKSSAGWDVSARGVDPNTLALGEENKCNTTVVGDQYAPQLSVVGSEVFVCWTSFGQDGSREGIYGRFISAAGLTAGAGVEFLVNTTTRNQQLHPSVGSDATGKLLVVWSSFSGVSSGFDLVAQRYSRNSLPLEAPGAPIVNAVSSSRVSVTWPEVVGLGSVMYEIYVDNGSVPIDVKENFFLSAPLAPRSSISFKLAYRLADGRHSPPSGAGRGVTWGEDANSDGLPDDWQESHFGRDSANWPGSLEDSDGDGASNIREFLAGTDPIVKGSVLRTRIEKTPQGPRLVWNTQAGLVYQVQTSKMLGHWENMSGARFAAEKSDSVPMPGGAAQGYFRVIRLK